MWKFLSPVGVFAAVMGLVLAFIVFVSPVAGADSGLLRCEKAGEVLMSNTGCPAGYKASPLQLKPASSYSGSDVYRVGDRLHRITTQTDADTTRQRTAIQQAVSTGKELILSNVVMPSACSALRRGTATPSRGSGSSGVRMCMRCVGIGLEAIFMKGL